ncbi:methylated-DNA--protein-cysteine methyltransferase [Microtetraspora sp. NBRC 13810]|uniref:methylated-DNA--[protein]-cysteine S-methyltransferase n=1 Tax=Microtetraspora sp. NBRC 13810 TaxID=3030990 RepID=UPI0024A17B4C|nr:methylated-DNA--[protein]-cysteine S-methyltransferase [Microtetraspora sp. NBRC 13810]GLW09096.1 methylated-DNA--protein-cysteine methyltransferase [Microtetraspora sp. NBRC 13810]
MGRTHTTISSPLGELTAVAEDGALKGLYFERHRGGLKREELGERGEEGFDEVRRQLAEYFAGQRTRFELPLAADGEDFQRQVWRLLEKIPFGGTRSYGDLARELGDVSPAQAVRAACARNPLSVVVPCHRVVRSDGGAGGYVGGAGAKRLLLTLESAP